MLLFEYENVNDSVVINNLINYGDEELDILRTDKIYAVIQLVCKAIEQFTQIALHKQLITNNMLPKLIRLEQSMTLYVRIVLATADSILCLKSGRPAGSGGVTGNYVPFGSTETPTVVSEFSPCEHVSLMDCQYSDTITSTGTIPLRVKDDIEDVSSELVNGS
ncbi:hypothetical protein TNCV_299361 [Trichonephila clavipes]|nr:hypothetical protein TNCV_299361 [Trichonephila clavipes]